MFTGFRLSLGIAWLVIVAAEMLTGRPGVGGFLWQEYNALIYEHIILSIIVIGARRLRARPADGPRRAPVQIRLTLPWPSSNSTTSPRASAAAPVLHGREPFDRARRVRRDRRLLRLRQDHADLADRRPARARTRGTVKLNDLEITAPGPDRGVVFQNYSLLPWLTVFENIALAVDQVFPNYSPEKTRSTSRTTSRW